MIKLLKIPHDKSSSYLSGTAKAPDKIIEAYNCDSANYFAEDGSEIIENKKFKIIDDFGINNNPENDLDLISKTVTEHSANKCQVLALGGDHSITYPVIKGLKSNYDKIDILHFDAHPDLYDNLNGDKYSHACPFARIMEDNLVENLIQIGIRCFNAHQREQAEKFKVKSYEMKDLQKTPELKFENPLYISFDIDVLDPAFAPGVSHIEPGGMSTREVLNILQSVKGNNIIGADIVEYNPAIDINGMTGMVSAKIMKDILSLMI